MNLNDIGWQQYQSRQEPQRTDETVGRVGVENKTNYVLHSEEGDLQGIIQGKFRHLAKSPSDYPKVGDWVVYTKLPNEPKAIIKKVLPRYSLIARKSAGESDAAQIIAANVDVLFILFGLDHEFNAPLVERYLAMAYEGGVQPIVILNKTDKTKYSETAKQQAEKLMPEGQVYAISAKTTLGLHYIQKLIKPGGTIAFVGPSGAGKSTLINALIGSDKQETKEVRLTDAKGRHTTTRREMFFLSGGGVLIDTPGIRELETLSNSESVKTLFADIETLAKQCRYKDCDHEHSKSCAVLRAFEEGHIAKQRYHNYLKLAREAEFHDSKDDQSLQWKRKARDKQIHKTLKQHYQVRKK